MNDEAGWMVLGVSDDGNHVGLSDHDKESSARAWASQYVRSGYGGYSALAIVAPDGTWVDTL